MGIVTDGLISYWHYQQGVSGSTWENIAPATKGQYNGIINGVTLQSDGMYFDGIDDRVNIKGIPSYNSHTIEMIITRTKDTVGVVAEATLSNDVHFSVRLNSTSRQQIVIGIKSSTSVSYLEFPLSVGLNTRSHLTFVFIKDIGSNGNTVYHITSYLNGVQVATLNTETFVSGNIDTGFGDNLYIGTNWAGYVPFGGKIAAYRIYNRHLNQSEISQNYSVGVEIGLEDEPTPIEEPPKVTILSTDRSILSRINGYDISIVRFKFDKDVTEWKVNVLGASHDTGTIADSGAKSIGTLASYSVQEASLMTSQEISAFTAGTEFTAEIDWTELYQEGQNRINIYGKGIDGQWTPYQG